MKQVNIPVLVTAEEGRRRLYWPGIGYPGFKRCEMVPGNPENQG